jgi:hypothetical protein
MNKMIATRFDRLLKEHGYHEREHSDYQGVCVYEKEHLYTKVVCTVTKDTHGKAQEMTFMAHTGKKWPKDMNEFKDAEFDRSYLVKEARMLYEMFEALKLKKGAKKVEISFTNFR